MFGLYLDLPDAEPVIFRFKAERIVLGRDPGSHIHLPEKAVSSRHCEFHWDREAEKFSVKDLGSMNGTKVNDASVKGEAVELNQGDEVLLGETVVLHYLEVEEVLVTGDESPSEPRKKTQPIDPFINPVAEAVARQRSTIKTAFPDRDSV